MWSVYAGELISVFQNEGGTFEDLLGHTASLTKAVTTRDQEIGAIINNLNQVVGTLASRNNQVGNLIGQLQRFATNAAADRGAISDSLGSIDDLAGSSATLLHDIRPGLDPDLVYLNSVLGTLVANKSNLDKSVKAIAPLLSHWGRVMSYGTWLNVYVCDFFVDTGSGVIALNGSGKHSVACR